MLDGKKQISLTRAIAVILITNIITFGVCITTPIQLIGNKLIIGKANGEFINKLNKLTYVKAILEEKYVDKIDEDKLVEGAVRGMVDGIGDPYTVYFNQKEFNDYMTHTQGSYTGIGIYVGEKDDKIVVVAPIEDTPAYRAGIKSGI